MPKSEFNGKIDGKHVKTIVKYVDGREPEVFAKPKNSDVNTPHFYNFEGNIEIHQDSADNRFFRKMDLVKVASGSLSSGITFVANEGLDLAMLPVKESADGFSLDTNGSGCVVSFPHGSEHVVMGYGNWTNWTLK